MDAYKLVEAPATEPVSLVEAKAFLRVDGTTDDDLINSLIKSARIACEEHTKRAFITQTWTLTKDGFGQVDDDLPISNFTVGPRIAGGCHIQLSREPIQSITSIETFDTANQSADLDAAAYLLDAASGRIVLNDGYTWPTELRAYASVLVTFVAGYGDAATDVPQPIRDAIKLFVAAMFENRQCMELPISVKTLLGPFRLAEAFGAY